MTQVTASSIAYIATQVEFHAEFKLTVLNSGFFLQVRFSLCSSSVFTRTDTDTDSERFYNSVLDLFDDVDEHEEVQDLLVWWNR